MPIRGKLLAPGTMLIGAAAILFAVIAAAQTIEENEALVVRLIFDDCLGHNEPFRGLPSRPLPGVAEMSRVSLFNGRYKGAWGISNSGITDREYFCSVRSEDSLFAPMVLGVKPDGFLDRVTARAADLGMVNADPTGSFTLNTKHVWRSSTEPGAYPMELVIESRNAERDSSLVEVSVIMVSRPIGSPAN